MVRLTLIARVHDGLPLAEGLDGEKDRELDNHKLQAKVTPPEKYWSVPTLGRAMPFLGMLSFAITGPEGVLSHS
jgi:hypothetical protein